MSVISSVPFVAKKERNFKFTMDTSSPNNVLSTFEDVLSAALSLPAEARAMLVDRLVTSLDEPNHEEIDAAWVKEAESRSRELDEGIVQAVDGELVLQRLRSRYKDQHQRR